MPRYAFEIDGYVFPDVEEPAYGPILEVPKTRWSKMPAIGATTSDATVMTFLGYESQEFDLKCRASTPTVNKLLALYLSRSVVTFKTPQNTVGFNVLVTELEADPHTVEGNSWYSVRFKLTRR